MPAKIIKIFLASSSELLQDRDEIERFIGTQNTRLHDQDVLLVPVRWENFLDAISDTRLQDEYNKAIAQCDIVLCLFFTKVGKYTAEEFDTAYQVFKAIGRPKIWTYFKAAEVNISSISDEINTLLAFKKKLAGLGHFYTSYTSIDNFKNQFRDQLDRIIPIIIAPGATPPPVAVTADTSSATQVANIFNRVLTRKLMEAMQVYNQRAAKFIQNATRMDAQWETQDRFSDPAKEVIQMSFVGVLGIQLRKLMAIGKEDTSTNKIKNYLQTCQLTAKRALQLVCFALISKLWDSKKDKPYVLTPAQTDACSLFFENEFDFDIDSLCSLLSVQIEIFNSNSIELPISELAGFNINLTAGSDFITACGKLNALSQLLDKGTTTLQDCYDAEGALTTVLAALSFLVNYKMVSIKNIDYYEMRNTKPHYLYYYTALGIDNKSNVNQDKVNYAESPINTDSVMLYKGNYQENVNLFPFIIDANALAVEGGAKICFYARQDNTNGSLNYDFLEDNSTINIVNTQTLKPGIDINDVLIDREKFKAMRFDNLFTLFKDAKKAITGLDDDEDKNSSASPF